MNKIMDYEKKYNEAFERAKEKYAMFEGMKQGDVLEDVFPELKESKESKDDRIKKAIKKALQVKCDSSRIISDEPVTLKEAIAWLEKQGEQKPWSEEDEKKLSDILAILRGGENCYYNSPTLIDWLKSLKDRIQPKVDWIKEDERLIEEVAECLRKYADKVQGVNSTVYVLSLADRIESLKPQNQWKPSEEQMKALDFAIDCTVYPEFQDKGMVLKELLEQLKKLKG